MYREQLWKTSYSIQIWKTNKYKGSERTTLRPKAVNRPTNRPIPARGSATVAVDKGPSVTLPIQIRPPLEGPYAFSRIPTPADDNPKIYLLRNPPPTWIFTSVDTGYTISSSSRWWCIRIYGNHFFVFFSFFICFNIGIIFRLSPT